MLLGNSHIILLCNTQRTHTKMYYTYNEKYRSQFEDGANDSHSTDEGGDDTSSYKQSSSRDDAVPSHEREVIVFTDQPATNSNDRQRNAL